MIANRALEQRYLTFLADSGQNHTHQHHYSLCESVDSLDDQGLNS